MFSTIRNRKGFTLIELMIVVVIIGILAALAIPRFMQASMKSKQSEAKGILKQIYTMEHAYRQEHDVYVTDLNTIGVELQPQPPRRYDYVIALNGTGFTATATANLDDDATIDTWTIDDGGILQCTVNDVTG